MLEIWYWFFFLSLLGKVDGKGWTDASRRWTKLPLTLHSTAEKKRQKLEFHFLLRERRKRGGSKCDTERRKKKKEKETLGPSIGSMCPVLLFLSFQTFFFFTLHFYTAV